MKMFKRALAAALMLALVIAVLPAVPAFAEGQAKTAYRLSADGKQVQLVSAVDSLNYKSIGFEVVQKEGTDDEIRTPVADNIVYSSITAINGTFTSADFGIQNGYVFVLIVNNLPEDAEFTARSFAVDFKDQVSLGKEITVKNGAQEDDGVYPIAENNVSTRLDKIEIKDIDGDGVIRVACLGDSITAGNEGNNWPMYLGEYLDYLGSVDGNKYEVHNHGKGGAAVHHVEEQVGDVNWGWGTVNDADGDGKAYFYYDDKAFTSVWTYTPDVVLIQFGTNDALGNYSSYMEEDYYTWLVKPFADQGSQIVMATPTYAENGWHNDSVNGPLHDYIANLAQKWDIPLVDLNRFLWHMPEVLADGLHGNVSGYSMMAQLYYKYVFGGRLIGLTFDAGSDAVVRITDESNDRTYIRELKDAGVATFGFIAGPEYDFTARVTKDCYAGVTQSIKTAVSGVYKYELEYMGENIALKATPSECGVKVYDQDTDHPHNSKLINDGDKATPGYQPDTWHEGDWCALTFDKAYNVSSITIYWETASYINEYAKNGYNVYFLTGGEWTLLDSSAVASSREIYSGDIVFDTLTFDAVSADGIKIEFLDGGLTGDNPHKYAPQLLELEVFA